VAAAIDACLGGSAEGCGAAIGEVLFDVTLTRGVASVARAANAANRVTALERSIASSAARHLDAGDAHLLGDLADRQSLRFDASPELRSALRGTAVHNLVAADVADFLDLRTGHYYESTTAASKPAHVARASQNPNYSEEFSRYVLYK